MCVCDPAVQDGHGYIEWIGTYFATCVYSPREIAGFIFGLVNIFLWLFAQAPQLWENYRLSRAESLSGLFLMTWLAGDICNLLGCILTPQFKVQLYTAIYFLCMDFLILTQWTYYYVKNRPIPEEDKSEREIWVAPDGGVPPEEQESQSLSLSSTSSRTTRMRVYAIIPAVLGLSCLAGVGVWAMQEPTETFMVHKGRTLLSDCDPSMSSTLVETVIGSTCAWLSGILYFTARIPQIMTNHRRKSTEGLSVFMFVSSTLANVCYSLSILLPESTDYGEASFWESTFAYLLGSGGTIASTIPILVQFFMYRKEETDVYKPLNA